MVDFAENDSTMEDIRRKSELNAHFESCHTWVIYSNVNSDREWQVGVDPEDPHAVIPGEPSSFICIFPMGNPNFSSLR
jgi:hypothetical protein